MPRAAFTTLGCKVNQFETEVIEGLFKQRGYTIVSFDEPADVYVINTCSVTHLGEKKSRQLIRRAARVNPEAVIVATGCYAQVSPDKVAAIPGVDVIVGTQDRGRIVDLVEEARRTRGQVNAVTDIMEAEQFEDIPIFDAPGRTRAFLKIQEGCTNFCTYCIIPYARGPLRSRSLDSVKREAEKLIATGFKEIVLTGIHLGAYGRDMGDGLELADAVETVLSVAGLVRLRLSSLESVEVSDRLVALMRRDAKLCPHLHLPLQAGDDHVLSQMNRHYTTEEYSRLVGDIRRRVPDLAVTTDVIVGFPGETPTMFANSLAFVERMAFAKVHIFPYSRRSGTPAATYPNQVPEEEKKRRVREMQRVAEKGAAAFLAAFVGREMEVLFETANDGVLDGLTGNYIRVYTRGGVDLVGTLGVVRLEKPYKDGLWGTLLA
ncbi:RNA modification enzyme, MiaB family [Thermosinus carboxydivorans Nor1]|uniref:Threonylcarbamoyladenosine tRNA methylthiotransferase MtaB n=1 Tax=Thermosinus carboxydivorans Nor1 TaxID=401526 RepID=A1HR14_9FIRM|nr:tRNA (N(6)-L-threonylcarbamoyladenosine(37)-C(2))-methylthiotransferase MtaB [Thermosinus carboxydivorans]EAX47522.1 RNA modification enzyme, MiaB family [Thermosinus carboxydivorans Nor1]